MAVRGWFGRYIAMAVRGWFGRYIVMVVRGWFGRYIVLVVRLILYGMCLPALGVTADTPTHWSVFKKG